MDDAGSRLSAVAFVTTLLAGTALGGCGVDGNDPLGGTSDGATTSVPSVTSGPVESDSAEADEGIRYLDPVFEEIETIPGLVYWPAAPSLGELPDVQVEDLTMDLYLPVGDSSSLRPVIVAFETTRDSWVVDDFVRRGYVVAAPRIRARPGRPDVDSLLRTRQGMVDAAAAVRWLRANAGTYGLHREAIAATGFSGAGIVSLALAWGQTNSPEVNEIDLFGIATVPLPGLVDLGDHLPDQSSAIAAAFPVAAWYPRELIDAGEPPVIMFNGIYDDTYPFASVEQICPAAVEGGVHCELRALPGGHFPGSAADISIESAVFLHEQMLAPLGIVDAGALPDRATDTTAASPPTAVPTEVRAPIDPVLRPDDVAVSPDGTVYVSTQTAILTQDDRGSWVPIDLDGIPIGTAVAGFRPTRGIAEITTAPDGGLWAFGWSSSHPDDVFFGGRIEGWTNERYLAWLAVADCDGTRCTWSALSSDDEPELEPGIDQMEIGQDGTLALTGCDGAVLVHDGTELVILQWGNDVSSGCARRALSVGIDGTVWVGTPARVDGRGGLLAYGPEGGRIRHTTDEGLPGDDVVSVAAAADATIWVGSAVDTDSWWASSGSTSGGVGSFDGTDWSRHAVSDGMLSEEAILVAGSDGPVWALHHGGYSRYVGSTWTAFTADTSPYVGRSDVGPDGTVWTAGPAGLVSFDGDMQIVYEAPPEG